MKPPRLLVAPLVALVSMASACGGAKSSESSFQSAAPSYEALAMDLTSSDATAEELTTGTAASALTGSPGGEAALMRHPIFDVPCHPHLFYRSHEVVQRVNRHLRHFLRHIDFITLRDPDSATDDTRVWERIANGIDAKFTMTQQSETVYTWTLEMKKVDDEEFVTVLSGQIDRAGAEGPHQGTGDVTLDLTKLAGVTGAGFQGVLASHFEVFTGKRLVVFDAQDVVWDADENTRNLGTPRDAHYVYYREPEKGGSLKIEEQMVFLCPASTYLAPADVKLVSRWYRTDSGAVNGRSDAEMTGGQLETGNKIVGLTCHQGSADGADQAEHAWLMKLEDASGATVAGGMRDSNGDPAVTCDPALNPPDGEVPSLDDNLTDFDMAGIVFTDSEPYPFPNT